MADSGCVCVDVLDGPRVAAAGCRWGMEGCRRAKGGEKEEEGGERKCLRSGEGRGEESDKGCIIKADGCLDPLRSITVSRSALRRCTALDVQATNLSTKSSINLSIKFCVEWCFAASSLA